MDKPLQYFFMGMFFGLLFFLIVFGIAHYSKEFALKEKITEIDNCYNLSIVKSAFCVKEYVEGFYFYNESNLKEDLTFEELKEQGGVCRHYSKLYDSIGNQFGFKTKEVYLDLTKSKGHIFDIWMNEEGYCTLDQLDIRCFIFEE